MNKALNWINKKAGVLLVAVALLSGSLYAAQVYEARDQAGCQAKYNAAFAKNLTERSRVTRNLLEGLSDALLREPTKDKEEQARRTAAFLKLAADYKSEIAKALPPIPEC